MNFKFVSAILVVLLAVSGLIFAAVQESAKKVVTVAELTESGKAQDRVRLGARVAQAEIKYKTEPTPNLLFAVHDIGDDAPQIEVEYPGVMPDTLRVGRDVIIEGRFDGTRFHAVELLTQCPSKYKPPTPGTQQQS